MIFIIFLFNMFTNKRCGSVTLLTTHMVQHDLAKARPVKPSRDSEVVSSSRFMPLRQTAVTTR